MWNPREVRHRRTVGEAYTTHYSRSAACSRQSTSIQAAARATSDLRVRRLRLERLLGSHGNEKSRKRERAGSFLFFPPLGADATASGSCAYRYIPACAARSYVLTQEERQGSVPAVSTHGVTGKKAPDPGDAPTMDPGAAGATLRKRALSVDTAASLAAAAIELESKGQGRAPEDEEEEEPVSPTGRLFREPHFRCHIVSVFGLAAPVDLPALRAGVAATLARHPRFCSVQVRNLGYF